MLQKLLHNLLKCRTKSRTVPVFPENRPRLSQCPSFPMLLLANDQIVHGQTSRSHCENTLQERVIVYRCEVAIEPSFQGDVDGTVEVEVFGDGKIPYLERTAIRSRRVCPLHRQKSRGSAADL